MLDVVADFVPIAQSDIPQSHAQSVTVGPSAGVTITVALVSLFTGRRVKSDFAMTGELSL